MNYSNLMEEIEKMVKSQMDDKIISGVYNDEEIKFNFIEHVKYILKSDCIILTKESLLKKCKDYNNFIDYYPEHLPY